jgi:hypothetical protein
MAKDPSDDFACPTCAARYKIVRMKAGRHPFDQPVLCLACGHPFASTEARFVLKYFLIDRPAAERSVD